MNEKLFNAICNGCVEKLRSFCPVDTGNLKYNAIRFNYVDNETFEIYVDESIAPYMPYTNEPWVSAKWNGKKNRNEGWFERATEAVANYIAEQLKGVVTKNDSAE